MRCFVSTNRRMIRVMLSALCAAAPFDPTACLATCAEPSVRDLGKYTKRPQDAGQLLRNIKTAFDEDFLSIVTFYSDANMMSIFDGASVQWHSLVPPEMQEATIRPGPLPPGIKSIRVRTWKTGNPPPESYFIIDVAPDSGLTLGTVRKVFGTATVPAQMPSHPMAPNAYVPRTYPSIAYARVEQSIGADCRATRVEARFSAAVSAGTYLGLGGPRPRPLLDDAVVNWISLKMSKE